jgi:Trypsin-like peptidase domain
MTTLRLQHINHVVSSFAQRNLLAPSIMALRSKSHCTSTAAATAVACIGSKHSTTAQGRVQHVSVAASIRAYTRVTDPILRTELEKVRRNDTTVVATAPATATSTVSTQLQKQMDQHRMRRMQRCVADPASSTSVSSSAAALPGPADGEEFVESFEYVANSIPLSEAHLDDRLFDSVVKVYSMVSAANYILPWQNKSLKEVTGSGFLVTTVDGPRILTNAHCVADQKYVMVKRGGNPTRYHAHVEAVGHECDLAVLSVEDADFWVDSTPLEFADVPVCVAIVVIIVVVIIAVVITAVANPLHWYACLCCCFCFFFFLFLLFSFPALLRFQCLVLLISHQTITHFRNYKLRLVW